MGLAKSFLNFGGGLFSHIFLQNRKKKSGAKNLDRKSSDKKNPSASEEQLTIPVHLAVIMDGNGRWAQKKHLPRSAGHRAGAENLKELCRNCGYYGVRFSGDIGNLPDDIQAVCKRAEQNSINRKRMDLIIAMNYGGRREITHACQKITRAVLNGDMMLEEISETALSENMYLPDVPDPDLVIRPSGEQRTSNFLVWEAAYAEFWVSETLWPDFGFDDLTEAFSAYSKRDRRFGGLTKSTVMCDNNSEPA